MVSTCIPCTKPTSPDYGKFEFDPRAVKKRKAMFVPYAGQQVRLVMKCFRCNKPRCLYAARQLSSRERTLLEQLTEDTVFSCGSAVLPPIHPLQGILYTKALNCDDPVEPAYYASNLSLPTVCVHCGATESEKKKDKTLSSLLDGLPTCGGCRNAGLCPKPFLPTLRVAASNEESSEVKSGGYTQ